MTNRIKPNNSFNGDIQRTEIKQKNGVESQD